MPASPSCDEQVRGGQQDLRSAVPISRIEIIGLTARSLQKAWRGADIGGTRRKTRGIPFPRRARGSHLLKFRHNYESRY